MKKRNLIAIILSLTSVLLLCQSTIASPLFFERRNFTAGEDPYSLAIGDLDGDGAKDIAVANFSSYYNLSLLMGNGDGTFLSAINYDYGSYSESVAIGDLDGNGIPDLALTSIFNNVLVLLNNGDGTFQNVVTYDAGEYPRFVSIGDIDDDGTMDLAVVNYWSDNVSVLLNSGDGTFQNAVNYDVGDSPREVAIGDLDGDGAKDLVVANNLSGNISVLFNNGDGTFISSVNYYVGGTSVELGDLDGNSTLDLVVANNTETVTVLLNNGEGAFQISYSYGIGTGPRSVAIGDLNGDSILDIAVANVDSNDISLLLGNGDGTFHNAVNSYSGDGPNFLSIGDLDNNNTLDLAVANKDSDNVSVFINLSAWYVDGDIAVSGDGKSWSTAFKTIQEAIDAADDNDKILVKQGTYLITSTINVDKSVAIYGGFDGTEIQMSERNWRTNVTTVDGQNAVRCIKITADATIDGFTIAHAQYAWGGAGMFISSSSPVVTNSTFLENKAGSNGGGAIHSWNATPTITNNIFLENDGGSNGGGAIFNWDCPAVVITNCTFSNNNGGSNGGGAIYNYISSATVTNSILWNDSADIGSEVYNDSGTLTISNCDIAGGIAGVVNSGGGTINDDGTNIALDPLFGADYHLRSGSDCIDAGTNSALELPIIDIDGEARIYGTNCDIGADEFYDSDGDNIPDYWEYKWFGNLSHDAGTHSDSDSLTDLVEFENGTNPLNEDSDSDGVNDDHEIAVGSNPNDPNEYPSIIGAVFVDDVNGDDKNKGYSSDSPFATIQHAIDVALGSEFIPVTINVAAGTYNEHLIMDSYESLEGGWNSDFSQQWDFENNGLELDPEYATIIDGKDNGICITQLEKRGANINGFTIQNGRAIAGGIFLDHSHPTVTNCIVKANHGSYSDQMPEYAAGGMYNHYSSPTVENCYFVENTSSGYDMQWNAFAVFNEHSQAIFVKCNFTGKTGWESRPAGNGMVNVYSSPIISECNFKENWSGNYTYGAIVNLNSSPVITSCSFLSNRIAEHPGAAMLNRDSNVMIINSEFTGNRVADEWGDAVVIENKSSECAIINCTFADNRNLHFWSEGVVSSRSNSHTIVWNSIFWDNIYIHLESFGPIGLYVDEFSTLEVYHSDIDQDGFAGINSNIRQDPMFIKGGWNDNGTPDWYDDDIWVGGDYHLQQDSPCINAGDNTALPPDTTDLDNDGDMIEPIPVDLDGNPRIFDSIVDMGAYEHHPLCLGDSEPDGDVDGKDLFNLIEGNIVVNIDVFAENYGRNDCL